MTVIEPKAFSYAEIEPITTYILPQKQATKRHYGSHRYFTKRAWNVVQSYIKHFTQPGDVVCDPYGGSGVTVIESLVSGRRGIYVDISEWARFLAEQVATAPIDIQSLGEAFHRIESACAETIKKWCRRFLPWLWLFRSTPSFRNRVGRG
jgi:DNA methylase